jgi:carbamoyl-phosphate synthase large subunit
VLQEYGVEMIGANRDAIKVAENRCCSNRQWTKRDLEMPRGGFAQSWDEEKRS